MNLVSNHTMQSCGSRARNYSKNENSVIEINELL